MGFDWKLLLSWGSRPRLYASACSAGLLKFQLQPRSALGANNDRSNESSVKVAPDQIQQAIEEWKNVCAPLMISEPGCLSEELLECLRAPDEFISLSNWESMEAIEAYRVSEAHERVKPRYQRDQAEVVVKHTKLPGS